LKTFIDWDITEKIIKNRKNKTLRQTQTNKKKRLKKTILLIVINIDTWDKYKKQLLNKKINKKRKNAGPKNNRKKKQSQS
jgi:hypothetical protein